MRWLIPAALGLALLSGCETPNLPPIGASATAIEAGRYHVVFRGVSGASTQEVEDRALLHAANLALGQGYDWLRVTGRTGGYASPTSPRITFGVGGGSFGPGGGVSGGLSRSVGSEPTYVADLEVVFGKGPKPGLDAYDARSVVETLGPRLAPPPPR
jgi:hypothetical protein